jgi:transcriptional regulator with XRE-family HTH domain
VINSSKNVRHREAGPDFRHYYHATSFTGLDFTKPEPGWQSWSPYEGLIGTGLGSGAQFRNALDGTHARVVQLVVVTNGDRQIAAPLLAIPSVAQSARDQIRFIQASLGLTVAQLASVLDVERQTIYNWLQAELPPTLHARTRTRLTQIRGIAHEWNRRCPLPAGKLAVSLDVNGATLLKLLSQAQIDDVALRVVMDALATKIIGARELRRERLQTKIPPPDTADDRIRRSATGIRLDTTRS